MFDGIQVKDSRVKEQAFFVDKAEGSDVILKNSNFTNVTLAKTSLFQIRNVSSVSVSDCTFVGNKIDSQLSEEDVRLQIDDGDSEDQSNAAALRINGVKGNVSVDRCTFIDNESKLHAGALGIWDFETASVTECKFNRN